MITSLPLCFVCTWSESHAKYSNKETPQVSVVTFVATHNWESVNSRLDYWTGLLGCYGHDQTSKRLAHWAGLLLTESVILQRSTLFAVITCGVI